MRDLLLSFVFFPLQILKLKHQRMNWPYQQHLRDSFCKIFPFLISLQGWRFYHTSQCALRRNVKSKLFNLHLGVVAPYIACHNQEECAFKTPSSSFRLLWLYLPFNLLFSKLNKPSSVNHSSQLMHSGPWLQSSAGPCAACWHPLKRGHQVPNPPIPSHSAADDLFRRD